MPELPEVEITARLIGAAVFGARIESAVTPGINALKTFDPPLSELTGATLTGVRRRGKLFVIETDAGLALLVHLMSAGRLQLYDKRACGQKAALQRSAETRRSTRADRYERYLRLGGSSRPV